MKTFRKFFMEDSLEDNRFEASFNLGESGGRARSVKELLTLSGLSTDQISEQFLNICLRDSPNWGRDDLRNIVAQMHPGASLNNVLITTGTSEALLLLFRYLKPQSVALAIPGFQLLYEIPMAQGAEIIPLPVRWNEAGVPFLDEEEWIQIIRKQKPECVLINNPHNPSGLILSETFIERLLEVCHEIDASIIGDEHYRLLSHETNFLGHTVYRNHPKVFVTGSFIKCLGCPGLRIGWCVGSFEALSHMQNEKNYTTHTVNPITEWISYEVLKDSQSKLFENMKQEWIKNKNILATYLKTSSKIYGMSPQGGLVTSLGVRGQFDQISFQEKIHQMRLQGIFVLPLNNMEVGEFYFQKEPYYKNIHMSDINRGFGFRLGLGCVPDEFKIAIEALD